MVPCRASGLTAAPSPLRVPAICPISPSRNTQKSSWPLQSARSASTDEPAHLREGGPECRSVDGHATASRRRALDDLRAAILGGRADTFGQGRIDRDEVHRPIGDLGRGGRLPVAAGEPDPGAPVRRRHAIPAELPVGRHVGSPAEPIGRPNATLVHGSAPTEVGRARDVGLHPSRRSDRQRAVARRRRSLHVRRSEARARRRAGLIAEGDLVGDGHAREHDAREERKAHPEGDPDGQPTGSQSGCRPSTCRASPNPLKRLVPSSASSQG